MRPRRLADVFLADGVDKALQSNKLPPAKYIRLEPLHAVVAAELAVDSSRP